MSDHKDESLIDKVKSAFGMGSDEHTHDDDHKHDDHQHDDHAHGADAHDDAGGERTEGWAGVDDALGDTESRPAGPDYAAQDAPAGIGDDSGGLGTAPLGGGTPDADRDTGSDPDRRDPGA